MIGATATSRDAMIAARDAVAFETAALVVANLDGRADRVVPVTTALEIAGLKTELPEIVGDVAVVDVRIVPLAGVAPTPIALVTLIGEVVVVEPLAVCEVEVTTPFDTCGAKRALPEIEGVVALLVGTIAPAAGVAPTPIAPVTTRGEPAAVVTPDPLMTAVEATPPPTPPVIPATPGE